MINIIIPLIFVGVGLLLLFIYFRNLIRVRASESWPASQGTIVASWVRESHSRDDDGSTSTSYYPEVAYTYSVMGTEYQNDKISFGLKTGGSHRKAFKIVSKYMNSSPVIVYYDPNNPQMSVLERSISKLLLVYGVIMAAIGIFIYIRQL